MLADMLVELIHGDRELIQGEVISADDLDNRRIRAFQGAPLVQQRRFQRRRQGIVCPIRAFGLTVSEVRTRLSAERTADLVKADPQKSAPMNQGSHRANTLTECLIRR